MRGPLFVETELNCLLKRSNERGIVFLRMVKS